MNTQENIKNDEINLQTDELTDLPVADEQADEVRGGPGGGTSSRTGGDWIMNHNETARGDEEDEINEIAQLADLPVADEQAGETRGGRRPCDPVEYIVVGSGAGGGPLA